MKYDLNSIDLNIKRNTLLMTIFYSSKVFLKGNISVTLNPIDFGILIEMLSKLPLN